MTFDLKDEIRRAAAEFEHWKRVHAEHPDWANPKMHLRDSADYLVYLKTRTE